MKRAIAISLTVFTAACSNMQEPAASAGATTQTPPNEPYFYAP